MVIGLTKVKRRFFYCLNVNYPKLYVITSCYFLAGIGHKGSFPKGTEEHKRAQREEIRAAKDLVVRTSTDSTSVGGSDLATSHPEPPVLATKGPAVQTSETPPPSTDAVVKSIQKLIGGETKLKDGSLQIFGKTQDRKSIACGFQFLLIPKVQISLTFGPLDVEPCNFDPSGLHGSG